MKAILPLFQSSGKRYLMIAVILLDGLGSAFAQGTPDIVWQGQHNGAVKYTTFSPDGQQLATGSDDRTNKLWQVLNGSLQRTITQCSGIGCRGSAFGIYSPDGQQLATTGIKFWNVADGTLARTLGIGGTIALSPDWQYIASSINSGGAYGTQTRSITLFRSDGSQVWQNSNSGGGATVFLPDGQSLATIGFQGIDILRVADGSLIRNIVGPRGASLTVSPDGQFLAINGGEGGSFQWDDTIKIFRVSDGALVRSLTGTGVVTSIVFTPDSQTLIASSYDNNYDPVNGWIPSTGSIRFWRLSDGALFKTYDQNTGTTANSLSVSPDGKLFSYAHDSTVFVARVPAADCVSLISPGSANFPTTGGSGVVNVSAPAGCHWTAVSRVNWITITGPSSGTGDGVVSYTATGGSSSMTGLLIIADQTFPVHLGSDPCTYTLSSTGGTWSADGGTGAVGVQTPGGCGWSARSNDDWITITKISRDSGAGSVAFSVAPSETSRTGTLTVAGQTVTVVQDINACRYTLSPNSRSIGSNGGVGTFSVTTTSDCPWTATSNASWVSISGGSGPGSGTVDYSVVENLSGLSRTATISVADKTFTIVQSNQPAASPTPTATATATATATPTVAPTPTPTIPPPSPTPTATAVTCHYKISPANRSFTAEGGSAFVNMAATDGCRWSAVSNDNWITITSGATGLGSGTIYYSVGANTTGSARTGTLSIAGQTFTVFQTPETSQTSPEILWTGLGHTAQVNSIAFSPDGTLLASASNDHTVKLWRVSDGALLATLKELADPSATTHLDAVNTVAFSHDGTMLASGSMDRKIKLWLVSDRSLIRAMGGNEFILGLAFSPDDQMLTSAGGYSTNEIKFWRLSDGQNISIIDDNLGSTNSVAYSPDGQFLAAAKANSVATLLNTSGGNAQRLGHDGTVNFVAFSSNNQTLATASDDQSARLWSIGSSIPSLSLYGPSGFVKSVSFSPNAETLLAAGQDYNAQRGTILFWRVSDGALLRAYTQDTSTAVFSAQFSPDGNSFAYGLADGRVILARNPLVAAPAPSPTPAPTATAPPLPTATPIATPASTPSPTSTPTATPNETPAATPTASPTANASSQPLNIATRGRVASGENAMIGGFIIAGETQKKVVIRAIGPSLQNSLADALSDPVLQLRRPDGSLILQNDNWHDDAAQAAEIAANKLAPAHDLESALVATLAPGTYTAAVIGKNGATGIGLVEVYDLSQGSDAKLVNISTRGTVASAENVLIGGFILGGANSNAKVLVRAIGPSLTNAGIRQPLSDPTLELRDGNGVLLFANDNWKDQQQSAIEQTGIPPNDSSESAILAELPAGAYTAIVAGKNNSSGVALIEVYNLR